MDFFRLRIKFGFMCNCYRTVYPSGDLNAIYDYLVNLQKETFFGGKEHCYACYRDFVDGKSDKKSMDFLRLNFRTSFFDGRMKDSISFRIFIDSSKQLVVDGFYSIYWDLFFLLMFLSFPFLLYPSEPLPVSVGGSLFSYLLVKVLQSGSLYYYCRFKRDLEKFIKEDPVRFSCKWKF